MNLEAQKRRIQNRNIALFLMVPTAVLAKIIQLFFLPGKYFYDSWRMVGMLTGENIVEGGAWWGYEDTVNWHKSLNVLNLSTVEQFSIFYGVIMTPIIMIIVSKTKEMEIREVIFTLMSVGVLNIYVFNINKEMIQIVYFIAVYIVISLKINNTIKIIACASIFYLESSQFRSYYIIMAALCLGVFIVLGWIKRRREIKKTHIIIVIISLFMMVFVFFYLSSYFSSDDYETALNIRDGTTNTIDEQATDGGASSAIRNPIVVDGNLGIFMLDYVINSVRMMVPVELLLKSTGYAPFFFYQFFILIYVFRTLKNLKKIDKKMIVALSCYIAFYLGSVVFEPDFGSWVRHEATTFPILQFLAYNSRVDKEADRDEAENV